MELVDLFVSVELVDLFVDLFVSVKLVDLFVGLFVSVELVDLFVDLFVCLFVCLQDFDFYHHRPNIVSLIIDKSHQLSTSTQLVSQYDGVRLSPLCLVWKPRVFPAKGMVFRLHLVLRTFCLHFVTALSRLCLRFVTSVLPFVSPWSYFVIISSHNYFCYLFTEAGVHVSHDPGGPTCDVGGNLQLPWA